MGTRADFYVGRGETAEWLGSIAWDGYPGGIDLQTGEKTPIYPGGPLTPEWAKWPAGRHLFDSATEAEYRERVTRFFQHRDDATLPEMGWPWPWETSHTTDFAYAFDAGKVYGSCFGNPWFDASDPPEDPGETEGQAPAFPDMGARKSVTVGGKRSGIMVISVPAEEA